VTMCVPIILRYSDEPKDVLYKKMHDMINITRRSDGTDKYANALVDIFLDLL